MPTQAPIGNGDQPVTKADIQALITSINNLAATNTWRKIGRWALAVGAAVVLALGVTNFLLYQQVKSTASCRSTYSLARANALDDWIRVFPTTPPKTPEETAKVQRDSAVKQAAYLRISDQYINAVTHSC